MVAEDIGDVGDRKVCNAASADGEYVKQWLKCTIHLIVEDDAAFGNHDVRSKEQIDSGGQRYR